MAANLTFVHPFKVKQAHFEVFDSVDVCVHPDYRNRGLYRSLRAFVNDGSIGMAMDLDLSATRVPFVARIADRYERRKPLGNTVGVFVKPLVLWRSGREPRRARLKLAAVYVLSRAAGLFQWRPGIPSRTFSLSRIERFDQRIDPLFTSAAKGFDFIGLRTVDYLNWRYADLRAGRFAITVAAENDAILGYSVLRLSHGHAYLADLLARPGRLDVIEALLSDASQSARAGGAASIRCWLPAHHAYRASHHREGYFRAGNASVYFEPTGAKDEDVAFLSDPLATVHFVLGDSDLV